MTNEELAALIRSGERDKLLELWEQVRRYAVKHAYRWERALGDRAGLTVEDLEQAAFLALLDALEGWDAERGTFIGFYAMRLKAAFLEAAGLRTAREREDPLRSAVSLEAPLGNDPEADMTVGDAVEDPTAAAAVDGVAEADAQQDRRAALLAALAPLPYDQHQAVLLRYAYGLTLAQTAKRMHTTRDEAQTLARQGLKRLRRPGTSRKLRRYL